MSALSLRLIALPLMLGVTSWAAEKQDPAVASARKWDCWAQSKDRRQVIWRSSIESFQAGALGMGGGCLLVGSIGGGGTVGMMTAFDTSGRLLWHSRHPKLPKRVNDMGQAIHSQPCVDGDRAYYLSNRGELMCVDLKGFRDDRNDGPYQNEKEHGAEDVDIVWKLDFVKDLGVFKREASDVGNPLPSPVVLGDLVFCGTEHGVYREFVRAEKEPPSFVAVDKRTGALVWSSNAPGDQIAYGQWSSPVAAKIRGVEQIIFPGGDGFLYSFEPLTGKLLWKIDCNEPGAVDRHTLEDKTFEGFRAHQTEIRYGFVGTPTVYGDMLYAALNEYFEVPEPLPLLAINLAAANGQPKIAWKFADPGFHGTFTSATVHDGIVFVTDLRSVLFAIDAPTGREIWQSSLDDDGQNFYGSPVVYRGRVYAGSLSSITVFNASPEKKCLGRYEFDSWPSPLQFAGDQMFVGAGSNLCALRLPE